MGDDPRSTKAGYRILLIAMAIQGLTPDRCDLASSWLLRLVHSGLFDPLPADGRSTPSPIPNPRGQDDGVPGESVLTVVADVTRCVRFNTGERPCVHHLPVGLLDRHPRSAPHSPRPPGVIVRRSKGLLLSLCRFDC